MTREFAPCLVFLATMLGIAGCYSANNAKSADDSGTDAETSSETQGDTEVPAGECVSANDCRLIDDCCNCLAVGADSISPDCSVPECFAPACARFSFYTGAERIACVAGRCVLNLSCDDSKVSCKMSEPACPDGQEPVVNETGDCWSNGCLEVNQCAAVSNCAVCTAEQTCVRYEARLIPPFHCVTTPKECEGDPTCDCLGESVCISAFDTCTETESGLNCSCPEC